MSVFFWSRSHITFSGLVATVFESNWFTQRSGWWISGRDQIIMGTHSNKNLLLQVFPSSRSIYPSKHWHTKESPLLTHACSQPCLPKAQGSSSENPSGNRETEEGNDSYISDFFNLLRYFRHLKWKQYFILQGTFQNRKHVYEQNVLIYKEHIK